MVKELKGKTFSDKKHSCVFLGQSPKSIEIKTKVNKWDLRQTYKYLQSKGNHKQNKRSTCRMAEKICQQCYQQELNFQNTQIVHTTQQQQKTNTPIKKWADDLNRHFFKEDIQIANMHMKRCSPSLIIWEMQVKTAMRYHFTLVRMAIFRNVYK